MKTASLILCFCLLNGSAQFLFAQEEKDFKVKTLINNGKGAKQEIATLRFSADSIVAVKRKKNLTIKEFNYTKIVSAEYSFSEKPLLSPTAAYASVLVFSFLAVPLMFIKRKAHWLSLYTADDYLVVRLDGKNYRQILDELEARKIRVRLIDEDNPLLSY